MKAYGLPRVNEVEFPDVGDIKRFGRPGHVGRLTTRNKDYHPYAARQSKVRKATRRYWKRRARRFYAQPDGE